jgi:hypothetical protein
MSTPGFPALRSAGMCRPNTGVKLRSFIMLGFVSFNSLFGGVVTSATATPSLAQQHLLGGHTQ